MRTVLGVKNKFVPLNSIDPASGVVINDPEVNLIGPLPATALPAFKCNLAVGDATSTPILPLLSIVNAVTAPLLPTSALIAASAKVPLPVVPLSCNTEPTAEPPINIGESKLQVPKSTLAVAPVYGTYPVFVAAAQVPSALKKVVVAPVNLGKYPCFVVDALPVVISVNVIVDSACTCPTKEYLPL